MLKIFLVCALLIGSSALVWWVNSDDSPFDSMEEVVDADEKTEHVNEVDEQAISDNEKIAEEATEVRQESATEQRIHQAELKEQPSIESPLKGFNVKVKDLKVSGKTIRVSPFAGIGVVSINICFKHAGKKLSPSGKESLVQLLSMALGETTELKDRSQLEAYARKQNVSISFSGQDDHFFINCKCPSDKLEALFIFLKELLFQAKFKDDDLERFKRELIASLMQSMQSPEYVLNEVIKDTVYKGHPYGVPNITLVESTKNVRNVDLKSFIKDKFTQQNLLVSVCGEFDEEKLTEQVKQFIDKLPEKFAAELPKSMEVSGPYDVISKEFPVPQTIIKFLHPGIDYNHPDFFALQVAIGCLSDPSVGLLFKKVRVESGLVYDIGAGLSIQEHFNAFGISTFTQTENVRKVIEATVGVISEVLQNGFPPELIDNIQKSFIGNYKRSFASSGQIASRLTNYQLIGRPVDYHNTLIEKIASLSSEEINAAFKKFINLDHFMIFTVGQ